MKKNSRVVKTIFEIKGIFYILYIFKINLFLKIIFSLKLLLKFSFLITKNKVWNWIDSGTINNANKSLQILTFNLSWG